MGVTYHPMWLAGIEQKALFTAEPSLQDTALALVVILTELGITWVENQ